MRNPFTSSLPGSTVLRIGIAQDGIALVKTGGWLRRRSTPLAECTLTLAQDGSFEAVSPQLSAMLKETQCANLPVSIVIADQIVRMFMVNPPQNVGSLRDCEAAAAMRFQQLYGEPLDKWQLRADWQVKHAFLACAIPSNLLAALQHVLHAHRLTLLSVAPQSIASWNQWRHQLKADAWFGVVHEHVLTLAAVDRQRICAIRTATVPEGAWQDSQWLTAHLTREAMLLNLPMPKLVQLCGSIPAQQAAKAGASPLYVRLGNAVSNAKSTGAVRLAYTGMPT
jgi:hypothetical protein